MCGSCGNEVLESFAVFTLSDCAVLLEAQLLEVAAALLQAVGMSHGHGIAHAVSGYPLKHCDLVLTTASSSNYSLLVDDRKITVKSTEYVCGILVN